MEKQAQLIAVREGILMGLWLRGISDPWRLPFKAKLLLEQLAGRHANEHHTQNNNSHPSPHLSEMPIVESPSLLHWNQVIMLVIAGRAEILG